MPAGLYTPSLAESFTQSKDGLTYEFVIRKGAKFHNGEPVTAADVQFSFERYKGAGGKILKERVREVCGIGSWDGWCLSLASYVAVTGPTDGATAAGGC